MHAPHPAAPSVPSTTDLFVTVPKTTLPNGIVVPSFQVGRYACSKTAAFHPGDFSTHKAAISAIAPPWVNIKWHDARKACEAAGYKLLSELQALAIAHDIAGQDINWSCGKVGEGGIYQGLHKGTVSSAQAASYEPADPEERRWHQLSNGERIWDFAGNCHTWIFDDVQGNPGGLVAGLLADDSPSITTAPYPSMEKGTGWRPLADRDWYDWALFRGGCWFSGADAGVFHLRLELSCNWSAEIGFRCTTR